MGFFKEFYEKGTFTKSINTTFLVLILKKGGAEDLKDFRPISLVGSLYKLLANRLWGKLSLRLRTLSWRGGKSLTTHP